MEAMVGACGSWGLNTAGINDHQAVSRRQRVSQGQRSVRRSIASSMDHTHAALHHRSVRDDLVQRRKGPRHLTQGFVQATI